MDWIACLPFAGLILSIAFLPLFAADFWHHHMGKVALGWSVLCLLLMGLFYPVPDIMKNMTHTMFQEYLPFTVTTFGLFTITGGIYLNIRGYGTPVLNTVILSIGTVLASLIGTSGASLLLIRPFMHLNRNHPKRAYQIVFFIFLVSNIGGTLTPLGDPPLFMGFLKGIDFFWPTEHLFFPYALTAIILLTLFYFTERFFAKASELKKTDQIQITFHGAGNFLLLLMMVGAILLSGLWKSGLQFSAFGETFQLENITRDVLIVTCALLSLWHTPMKKRQEFHFSWEPFKEVAKLFFNIFITLMPVIQMVKLWAPQVAHTLTPSHYFWYTGLFSSFLDNAPTYIVFFNAAGGNPTSLMTEYAPLLISISLGSVFLGAMTYIGNAPNFMVRSIAQSDHIKMPSFVGYMKYSICILLPIYMLINMLFLK